MCIVAKNSKKLVKSDCFGWKPYSHIHLVRRIPSNQEIPQVLLLVVGFGDKSPKNLGYSTSFTGISHQNNQFKHKILHKFKQNLPI